MDESKKAKFFCESCGSEVRANARFCPKCGRFFASVKCPKCGKVGDQNLFKNGCPACGYANPLGNSPTTPNEEKKHSHNKINFFSKNNRKERRGNDSLPSWIYILSMISLAVIIIVCLLEFKA